MLYIKAECLSCFDVSQALFHFLLIHSKSLLYFTERNEIESCNLWNELKSVICEMEISHIEFWEISLIFNTTAFIPMRATSHLASFSRSYFGTRSLNHENSEVAYWPPLKVSKADVSSVCPSLKSSLRWRTYFMNSVDKNKLPLPIRWLTNFTLQYLELISAIHSPNSLYFSITSSITSRLSMDAKPSVSFPIVTGSEMFAFKYSNKFSVGLVSKLHVKVL